MGLTASVTVTVADDDALAAPGSVTVTAQVLTLRIGWGAVAGADGYKVQWKSGQAGYDPAEREESTTGTTHTVTGLAAGTEYTVRVIPTRTGANDGPASAEATGTPLTEPTLAIDAPSVAGQVRVSYGDAGTGTATAGEDYAAITPRTLTFAPGTTRRTVAVAVIGDAQEEADETVVVRLRLAVNATLATGSGTGTIVDDDDAGGRAHGDGGGRRGRAAGGGGGAAARA